jgi:hypothetical protein
MLGFYLVELSGALYPITSALADLGRSSIAGQSGTDYQVAYCVCLVLMLFHYAHKGGYNCQAPNMPQELSRGSEPAILIHCLYRTFAAINSGSQLLQL